MITLIKGGHGGVIRLTRKGKMLEVAIGVEAVTVNLRELSIVIDAMERDELRESVGG